MQQYADRQIDRAEMHESMTSIAGEDVVLSIEDPGGLEGAHLVAHLDGELVRGGRGLRLRLPEGFDLRAPDLPGSTPPVVFLRALRDTSLHC